MDKLLKMSEIMFTGCEDDEDDEDMNCDIESEISFRHLSVAMPNQFAFPYSRSQFSFPLSYESSCIPSFPDTFIQSTSWT